VGGFTNDGGMLIGSRLGVVRCIHKPPAYITIIYVRKIQNIPAGTFFVTLTAVGWMDVFTRAEYCELIVENLNYCVANKGLGIYSYVLMPSHLHMVAFAEKPLNHILRDFKSFTAKRIVEAIKSPSIYNSNKLPFLFITIFIHCSSGTEYSPLNMFSATPPCTTTILLPKPLPARGSFPIFISLLNLHVDKQPLR